MLRPTERLMQEEGGGARDPTFMDFPEHAHMGLRSYSTHAHRLPDHAACKVCDHEAQGLCRT